MTSQIAGFSSGVYFLTPHTLEDGLFPVTSLREDEIGRQIKARGHMIFCLTCDLYTITAWLAALLSTAFTCFSLHIIDTVYLGFFPLFLLLLYLFLQNLSPNLCVE